MKENRSIGVPDHHQKVTIFVKKSMLAQRWIEENIIKDQMSKAPTVETIHTIDYTGRFELFETACNVFAIPLELLRIWSRIRFFSRFRATLTSWLYVLAKNHMKKHQKEFCQFLAENGPEVFMRPLLAHRNGKNSYAEEIW